MDGRGRKAKGRKLEKHISEVFGEWVVSDPYAFVPSRGSGATVTQSPFMKHHPGDVVPALPSVKWFPFCIETKHQEGWILDSLWTRSGILESFWKQARDQSKVKSAYWNGKLHPLLVFTRNRGNHYLQMEILTYRKLGKELYSAWASESQGSVVMFLGELVQSFTYKEVIDRLKTKGK